MTLNDYQKQIDEWAQQFDKPYWSPLSQYARLVEEVGEFGRLVNHVYGDKPKKQSEAKQEFPDELGDILFNIMCIANSQSIDLDKAMEKTIQKAVNRDSNRFAKASSK